jgi:hypothetical protein
VIGKVCKRGSDVRRLLGYLFREGLAGEHGLTAAHIAPRLIAAWDGADGLEPPRANSGGRDLRLLAAALNAPLLAAGLQREDWREARPVYHLAIAAADEDRQLSDEQWADIAAEYVDRIGLAPQGDEAAVRWVAVRHADNHVHVVATLARQDGKRVWPRNDFYRSREASRAVEERYGLRQTSSADRTGPREITRAEQRRHLADEVRRREKGVPPSAGPDRDVLRRRVRVAAAGATDLPGFFARLGSDGVLVKERRSQRDPEQVTGYAVALPAGGEPVWFGGGKLAPDLSLPRLQDRWASSSPRMNPRLAQADGERASPLSASDRTRLLEQARLATEQAAEHIRTHGGDPAVVADATWASADLFAAVARVTDYRYRTGKATQAADLYEQAARPARRRTPEPTGTGHRVRNAAGALLAVRRTLPSETRQVLALLAQLQSLAATVARLRETQGLAAQAAAARAAAEQLAIAQPVQGRRVPIIRASGVRLLAYGAPAAAHRPIYRPAGPTLR